MLKKPASTFDVDISRRIEDTTRDDLVRDAQILNDFKASDSEIGCFFKGKSILITGATGFVGKVLLEKLLRSCPEISTVFIIIRVKKGKKIDERLNEFLKESIFDRLQKERPNYHKQIVAIEGDVEQVSLGINDEDRAKIQQHVSVFFHAAASVRFNEPLRKCVHVNVRGTRELLNLATGCAKLESVVHFSTAYSHCVRNEINEEFYEPPMKAKDLINLVENNDEATLEKMTPALIGKHPNTYSFSKAVTEDMIREYGRKLPVCVIRPSIIVGTYREPVRGWVDTIYGLSGIFVGAGTGVLHTIYCDEDKTGDIVPVDMVANAAIVTAWRTASEDVRSSEPLIYNYVSSVQKPITFKEIMHLNYEYSKHLPTIHAIWYYSFKVNKNWYMHMLSVIFLHYLPALIVDAVCLVLRKKVRMLKAYKKITAMCDSIAYFTTKEWIFSNTNTAALWLKLNKADQHLFHFNIADIEWTRHAETCLAGLRIYLIKEPFSTLPEARKKWRRLKYLHIATKLFFRIFAAITIGYLLMKIVM